MSGKRVWILLAVAAALTAVLWLGIKAVRPPVRSPDSGETETDTGRLGGEETGTDTASGLTEPPFLTQVTTTDTAEAYVLVKTREFTGLLPLPTEGHEQKTIRQTMTDGTEAVNVLYLTPEGFRMAEANCEGQDCVHEGEVTLENRETRVLWNMIICLPHQLSAELVTREEALAILK